MPGFLWTQKQDFGPKARKGHAMAYDTTRTVSVLFGGDSLGNGLFNDTWEWDGEFWTQLADMGPGARKDHSMAYDADKKQTILFGGTSDANKFGDTWSWNGNAWTQLSNSGPGLRSGHSLVFNSLSNTILLFGGESNDLGVLGDTWEFNGDAWTQLDETGPPVRKFHCMSFDTIRNRVVLFGGRSADETLGDTWEWNGASWIQTADFGPAKCLASSMVFTNSHATIYGGISSPNSMQGPVLYNNSWDWDGKHWTQRQDIGPGARWGHAMCFDIKRSTIVLFGGLPVTEDLEQKVLSDTWEHLDTSTPGPVVAPPSAITIVNLQIAPNQVTTAQVSSVIVTVTLSAPVTLNDLTLPVFFLSKQVADVLPLDPSVQPTPLPPIVIRVNNISGQTMLGGAVITETVVILVPQPNDPSSIVSDVLTIV